LLSSQSRSLFFFLLLPESLSCCGLLPQSLFFLHFSLSLSLGSIHSLFLLFGFLRFPPLSLRLFSLPSLQCLFFILLLLFSRLTFSQEPFPFGFLTLLLGKSLFFGLLLLKFPGLSFFLKSFLFGGSRGSCFSLSSLFFGCLLFLLL
jgi:hypothetical protein